RMLGRASAVVASHHSRSKATTRARLEFIPARVLEIGIPRRDIQKQHQELLSELPSKRHKTTGEKIVSFYPFEFVHRDRESIIFRLAPDTSVRPRSDVHSVRRWQRFGRIHRAEYYCVPGSDASDPASRVVSISRRSKVSNQRGGAGRLASPLHGDPGR